MKHKIKTYKGVDIFYHENDGMVHFGFDGYERETKYVFEAEKIIDHPVWEECNMHGYFVDGFIDKYIGTAVATKRDIKTNTPRWSVKGQYDLSFKEIHSQPKVFLKNEHNDRVYKEWSNQRGVYHRELRKLNEIVGNLN